MIRCNIVGILLAAIVAVGCNGQSSAPEPGARPNFLLIVADDMGYTDLGAFGGGDIRTPNLDALALSGIRFTNFHGHLSCAPSRALLLTGTGNHEAGLGTQVDFETFRGKHGYERYLTDRVATLPGVLGAAGYRTVMAGKWGLGGPLNIDPAERGFQRSLALVPSGGGHYQPIFHDERFTRDGKPMPEPSPPVYSTTLFVDALIGFFEERRDTERPYFAMFAPTAPHWPLHTPPGMGDAYTGIYDDGYAALRRRRMAGAAMAGVLPAPPDPDAFDSRATPWSELDDDARRQQSRIMEIYAAMTEHMDAETGRLLAAMERTGALDNTLILFVNDNGAQGGPVFGGPRSYSRGRTFDNDFDNLGEGDSWANMGQGWAEAVTAPYRGSKATVHEGGLRVAAFAHWTGSRLESGINGERLTAMDVMPTLLELANVEHPAPEFERREVLPMRGRSFASLLRGQPGPIHAPDEAIALSSAGRHFLYRGDYKILRDLDAPWELYNLALDPYEQNDRARAEPVLLADLLAEFERHAQRANILDR